MCSKYHSILVWFSSAVIALTITLHVFNLGGEEGLKPFHLAAALACVIAIFYIKKDRLFVLLCLFLCCVFISALVSPIPSTISGFVNLFVVTLCCYSVSKIQLDPLLKCLAFLIPIDLLALMFEAISNPVYRFHGFYNDPNYLCTTLIVFFFLSILTFYRFDNKILRLLAVADIVMIVVLVLFTLSRTGLACIVLLLVASFANMIKRHFWRGVVLLLISAVIINHYAEDFIDKEYTLLYERLFERSDNLESASELRTELAKQNLRFIADNPTYLFFGLGPSATSGDNAKQIPGLSQYRKSPHRDHNTWTSCLSEYGLFAFLLFFMVVSGIIKRVLFRNNGKLKFISITACLSILIFSLSIWQMTYLPFWWGLFLFSNKQLHQI